MLGNNPDDEELNWGDAIGWNLQLACQGGGAHVEFLQFLGQMFSGMDREQWHVRSFRRSFPTGNRLLVVIDNFNIRRTGGTFWPFEANTPLVVDADAVLGITAKRQPLRNPRLPQRTRVPRDRARTARFSSPMAARTI